MSYERWALGFLWLEVNILHNTRGVRLVMVWNKIKMCCSDHIHLETKAHGHVSVFLVAEVTLLDLIEETIHEVSGK